MNCFARVFTTLLTAFCIGTVSAQLPAGSVSPKRMQPATELERGPRQHRRIALTFDAGGSSEDLPTLLRVLEDENVIATFFLTGKWVREYPACASQIATQGHVIGNHTWGHKDLTKLTDGEIAQELLRADDLFMGAFGCRYLPLFRAPFGEVDSRVLGVVNKLGFRAIRWSLDTLDSMEPRNTASFIEHRVLDRSDEELCGAIVLMHVGYPETCAALPVVIHNLRERGFEFVPVTRWVVTSPPALAGFRLNARLTNPSILGRYLSWCSGLPFGDQAMKTVFHTSTALEPEQPSEGPGTGGPIPSANNSNHRNTTMKP